MPEKDLSLLKKPHDRSKINIDFGSKCLDGTASDLSFFPAADRHWLSLRMV
jgi:hypothetical protein